MGIDDELIRLKLRKVVPGLLKTLETGGRRIEPCFCRSDMCPGNVKV
jgi:hypothetical protein